MKSFIKLIFLIQVFLFSQNSRAHFFDPDAHSLNTVTGLTKNNRTSDGFVLDRFKNRSEYNFLKTRAVEVLSAEDSTTANYFNKQNFPPPTITSFSPSSGTVGSLVTIIGHFFNNLTSITIGGVPAIPISNNTSVIVAMVMPGTTTGGISLTTAGGTANSTKSFSVITHPLPELQQGNKMIGTGAVGFAQQGQAVALSGDGYTAVVGGASDNNGIGAAWVYARDENGLWTQTAKLVGQGSIGIPFQGRSVAISFDGNTVLVGGPGDNYGAGATWVFSRSLMGNWTQVGSKLVGTGGNFAKQGSSVAINGTSNTLVVGGEDDNNGVGASWIFTKSITGDWVQQGSKLTGNDVVGKANQGYSVAISLTGNTVLVGGIGDRDGQGAAWVYTRTANVWSQQGSKLIAADTLGKAQQGRSVALSHDGLTAIIGGPLDNGGVGAAWIFKRSGGTWTQQTKLVGSGVVGNAQIGMTVSINGNGTTAIVGGGNDNGNVGAAWVFTNAAGVWSQNGSKLVGTGALGIPQQGYAISISGDGGTAIVGGFNDNFASGAAWIFTQSDGLWTQQGDKLVGTGTVGFAQQGYQVAVSADGNTAVVGGGNDDNGVGAVWIYKRNGITWSQQGTKLVGTGYTGLAMQGSAVAISADGNTVVVGGNNDNNGIGAIWIFTRSVSDINYPTWSQQGEKLVGSSFVGLPYQGYSVAISADGNTVISGGIGDDFDIGAVWVFTRDGENWSQSGNKLVGDGVEGGVSSQGFSLAISADGNTALVGGNADNAGIGAVWVFTRSGLSWTQQGSKLVGTGVSGTFAQQGYSVDLSADGNTAIVGGIADDGNIGAAWIFTRSGSLWSQQGPKIVGTGYIGTPQFGTSVSISADGNTAIISGSGDNNGDGAVWVYKRSSGTWLQQGNKLVGAGSTGTEVYQGSSVAISSDGNTIIFGGLGDDGGVGAVWVFAYVPPPMINSASYNVSTGQLIVECQSLISTEGVNNDINLSKLSITGNAVANYVLTTGYAEINDANSFTVTLNATDRAALIPLFNKNGILSKDGTSYNIAASADWVVASVGASDLTENSITVSNSLAVTASGTLTTMTSTYGTVSTYQNFTVSGVGLTENLIVSPPLGFEVSLGAGGGYGATVSLTPTLGNVVTTTIYVRLRSTLSVTGSPYNGNIVVSSTGADDKHVALANSIVDRASLTISANSVNKPYGSVLTSGVMSTGFSSIGLQNGESIGSVTMTYGAGSAANATVGTYAGSVTLSAATGGTFNADNYTISYTSGDIVVGKASLSIIAHSVNKTYGTLLSGGSSSVTFSSTGLQNGETIGSVTISYGAGSAANAAAGTYTGSVIASAATGGTFTADNYTISYASGDIVIEKAMLSISAHSVNKTYGTLLSGGSGSVAYSSTGLQNGETIGSVTISYGTGSAANATVGTYAGSVTPSAATGGTFNADNYSISYLPGDIVVGKATLSISANSVNKPYGSVLTSGVMSTGFSSIGLQNGESIGNVTMTYGTGSSASATVGTYTGSVTPSAATGGTFNADNYTISYTSGDIVVGKASLSIIAHSVNKTYGTLLSGGSSSVTFSSTGLQNGETIGSVTISYGAGSAANAAAGTYTGSVIASAASGGTFTADNYTISYASGDIVIEKAMLSISAHSVNKTYGTLLSGGSGSVAFSSTGLQNGESIGSVTISYGTGSAADAAAGTYTGSVIASAATGGTFNADNYTISYTSGDIVVGKAMLSISAHSVNKTYGTLLSGGSGSVAFSSTGLQNGETIGSVTISYGTGSAANATVGTYAGSVTISSAIGGTFNTNNYLIKFTSANIIVTPVTLTIKANDITKCEGIAYNFSGFEYTVTGLLNRDNVSQVTLNSIGADINALASTTPYVINIHSAIGTGIENYKIQYVNGLFTVNKLTGVIATSDVSKVSKGKNVKLSVTAPLRSTVSWTPSLGIVSPDKTVTEARVIQKTTYTALVKDFLGCSAISSVTVDVIEDFFVDPVIVFSPNGDGINDRFIIKNLDQYPNNRLRVFDYSGKVIYSKDNYDNTWDGIVGGKRLISDTYYYELTIKGKLVKRGAITLVANKF